MNIKLLVFSHLWIVNLFCFSQENKKIEDSLIRSEYIQLTHEKMNLRADFSSSITGYNFYDVNTEESVHLIPNERFKNRISLAYRKINVAFSFSPNGKPFNDDDEIKGPSSTKGFEFGYTGKKYVANAFYNKTKGFYVFNTEDYRTVLSQNGIEDKYLITPNVASKQIGIENSYFFNGNKYSTKFAKNQSEIQLKSTGSMVAYLQLLYSEIDGRNENFENLPNFSNEGSNFRHLNKNYYGLAGFGYGYNWIISQNIYITALFYPAVGMQYLELEDKEGRTLDSNTEVTVAAIGELAGGYQYKNLYGGGFVKFGAFTNPFADNQLASGNLFVMGYIGYRFNAPKFVSKFFDKAENFLKKKKDERENKH